VLESRNARGYKVPTLDDAVPVAVLAAGVNVDVRQLAQSRGMELITLPGRQVHDTDELTVAL
jgi:hypothetical protein